MDTSEFNLMPLENLDTSICPRPAQFPYRIRRLKGVLSGGKVVVCGGSDGSSVVHDECLQYQESTDEWTLFATMLQPRDDLYLAPLDEDDFWVIG